MIAFVFSLALAPLFARGRPIPLEAPEVRAKAKELYMSVLFPSPDQFAGMIREAVDAYGKIVRTAGIQRQ